MRLPEHSRPPGTPHNPDLAARARSDFAVRAQTLTNVLSERDYLLGSEFSGADILIGHSCFMVTLTGLIGDYPVLAAYYARLQQRPAHQRAYPDFSDFIRSFDSNGHDVD